MDKHVKTFSQVEQQVYIIASIPIKTVIKTSRYKSQKFLTESSFCFSVAIISIHFADTVYVFIQNSPGGYLAKVIVPQNSKTQVMLRKERLLSSLHHEMSRRVCPISRQSEINSFPSPRTTVMEIQNNTKVRQTGINESIFRNDNFFSVLATLKTKPVVSAN